MTERCETCGADVAVGSWPWCPHGTPSLVVESDSIPGGMLVENLGPEPRRFYSRTEWQDAMREKGVINAVQHVGVPGTDKSPHTTRWI